MKNLDEYTERCQALLDSLEIPYRFANISYNGRISTKWGYCKKIDRNRFIISIASILGDDNAPEQAIMSVLLHEYLHTCPGCFNHGKKWKEYAKKIKKITGIKIKTSQSADNLGIDSKYYIKCRNCKQKVWYTFRPRNCGKVCPYCGSRKLTCFYKEKNHDKERIWKR